LWIEPLEAPLRVLATGIAIGVVVLIGGILIDAVEHIWRGLGREWLRLRAGLVLAYVGLVSSFLWPKCMWLSAAGLVWTLSASTLGSGRAFGQVLTATLGESVETLFQLLINTVSFARVGAFALAHAGLSTAIVGMAQAAGRGGYWLVLLLGNVLILALEGLVVAIQTTRLVLFEFFVRFLRADGRSLRPLPPPPGTPLSR
jgi:V/A-type H+-transporting ATPase subunit I